jgi:hypothetical protein
MRHPVLVLCLALAAACSDRAPIPAEDLALRITTATSDVELGRAFPLTVVRVWSRDLTPAVWRDDLLAPLALKPVDVSRREDGARVEETRHFDAYAFLPGDVTVPAPSFRARPRTGGPERVVTAEPLALTVRPALDPENPGPVELPGGPVRPPFPWLAWSLGLAAAVAALVVFLRMQRARPAPPAPAPAAPPPPGPHERALARLAALRGRAAGDAEPFYVEAADIVREYVGERFRLRAAEMTSEELVAALPHGQLETFLRICDLVKFAGARPGPAARASALDQAEAIVRETTP